MKKNLLVLAAIAALGLTSASANSYIEKHIGYTYTTIGDESGSGVDFGAKLMFPTQLIDTGTLEFGVGINAEISAVEIETAINDSSSVVYGSDLQGYVGYKYGDIVLRGGVGYGGTVVTSDSYIHGVVYSGSVGYRFSDSFGAEVEYRGGSMSLETTAGTGPDVDQSQVVASVTWGF